MPEIFIFLEVLTELSVYVYRLHRKEGLSMNHQGIMQSIHDIGLLPAVVLDDESHAGPLARALFKGSLPLAEVMLRTPAALSCLSAMHKACPEML